jgi:pSer/pThr/pTyr-binding forkhead associated (FHA) protein
MSTSCCLLLAAGNGSFEHIGDEVPLPQAIPLKEGVFEVGRASPADIQIPIPTVSSRHALLRVGEWPWLAGQPMVGV